MTPTPTMSKNLLMAAAAILFLMDSSQKVIKSSEIPREQPYQSNQQVIEPTTFFFLKNDGFWQKYMGRIALSHRSYM